MIIRQGDEPEKPPDNGEIGRSDALTTAAVYDRIGRNYVYNRRPDPRWAKQIHNALHGCRSVLNVGAGAGSYEPPDKDMVALEPSGTMIRQRPAASAPAVCGIAEQLPFRNDTFDAATAILTVHHWSDPATGLAELRRVAARQIVMTWDPEVFASEFWLVRDYLPEAAQRETNLATLSSVLLGLGEANVYRMMVPWDCTDGVFAAYWRRPEAYLDGNVRSAIAGLALLDQELVQSAMQQLEQDLCDGSWKAKYRRLADQTQVDLGYRLVIAEK